MVNGKREHITCSQRGPAYRHVCLSGQHHHIISYKYCSVTCEEMGLNFVSIELFECRHQGSKLFAILLFSKDLACNFWGFHKLDKIGNNANIGIRGFTT